MTDLSTHNLSEISEKELMAKLEKVNERIVWYSVYGSSPNVLTQLQSIQNSIMVNLNDRYEMVAFKERTAMMPDVVNTSEEKKIVEPIEEKNKSTTKANGFIMSRSNKPQ